jgi:hypothetical protein
LNFYRFNQETSKQTSASKDTSSTNLNDQAATTDKNWRKSKTEISKDNMSIISKFIKLGLDDGEFPDTDVLMSDGSTKKKVPYLAFFLQLM